MGCDFYAEAERGGEIVFTFRVDGEIVGREEVHLDAGEKLYVDRELKRGAHPR